MLKLRCYGRTAFVCAGLVLLAACGREGHDEMSWARAALERNNGVEVVAADQQSHTFTIRLKDSGELRTVRTDQIVAYAPGATPVVDGKASAVVATAAAPAAATPADADQAMPSVAPAETESQAPAAPRTQQASLTPQTTAQSDGGPGRL